MCLSEELLSEFIDYANKDAELTKKFDSQTLNGFDQSSLNCIQCIGSMEEPNVTSIAEHMGMTRGAISKIVRRLTERGAITSWQLPENRQKIFFRLTEFGRELYNAHEQRHNRWSAEAIKFFDSLKEEEKIATLSFMKKYNAYLSEVIDR